MDFTLSNVKSIPKELRSHINLDVPGDENKVLIHSCCAPCSAELTELMLEKGLDITVFFYNPNIHPRDEYERRKQENIKFTEKLGVPFVDADYDYKNWFDQARGMEDEPERGIRCTMCFDMRFIKTAEYAKANGFKVIATSLGISTKKDLEQVHKSGHQAASLFEGVQYWDYNWRKGGGIERNNEISGREGFYRQDYCGCLYSLRDRDVALAKRDVRVSE